MMVELARTHYHWEGDIEALVWPDESYVKKGEAGVVAIKPFSETGEMNYTLWFEVTHEDGSKARVNSRHLALVRGRWPKREEVSF